MPVAISKQIWYKYINPWLIYNYFRFEERNVRHIEFYFRFQFRPHHRNRHTILLQVARCHLHRAILYGVVMLEPIFKMAAATAQFYFRFRTGEVCLFRMSVAISKPNLVGIISIRGWDITISGLEKQTFAILEFCFRFQFRQRHRNRHAILHQKTKFHPIRIIIGGVMMLWLIFKMAAVSHDECASG